MSVIQKYIDSERAPDKSPGGSPAHPTESSSGGDLVNHRLGQLEQRMSTLEETINEVRNTLTEIKTNMTHLASRAYVLSLCAVTVILAIGSFVAHIALKSIGT